MRTPKSWKQRNLAPWTPTEDAALTSIATMGLCTTFSSEAYRNALPDRRYGEVLERRLELVEAGSLTLPAPL